ncbi:MAG TPA: cytochrome d ubiquinol oxidase subunit II [Acetobacteraceae bacterium]|nr:cytochrome d ubiquinol oxidase subunit II [Acetobacteraceae bacterium]
MTEFWVAALALTIFLYVILDGFDLGVGMLFPFIGSEAGRRHMLAAIAPVWDGNETWLVLNATILFGMFPVVYATLLSAFYVPLFLMLAALIFRGVAFEFRGKSTRMRQFWDAGFVVGSFVATFIQGVTIGALVHELPLQDGKYVGGPFGWASPFALLCGVGLWLGYMLLGAGWLTYKTTEDVQKFAFRLLPKLMFGVLAFLVVAFFSALYLHLPVMHRWIDRPLLFVFPLAGILACWLLFWSVSRRRELLPFLAGIGIFAAAMGTLAISFYPYMIPFSITVADAAAPYSSQVFFFWGAGLVALPLTLIYTLVVYFVFKGKTSVEPLSY